MVQRAPAHFVEQGTTLKRRPETADRAKRQRVDDFAVARTSQQSAEALGSARRRSAREATRQQTAASDLTAARQPTTARQVARSAQTQQRRAATSIGAPAKQTNADIQAPQQQYRPSKSTTSNTTAGRRSAGTEAKVRLRNQASHRLATSGDPDDPFSSHQAPNKKRKVSRDLPDAQAGTSSLPSASNAAFQLKGKRNSLSHGATSSQRDAAKHAQRDDPHLDRQPTGSDPPSTSDSQDQAAPKARRPRTEGMLHPTFHGVKTSTQGVTHHVVHEAVKQVWSAFLKVPSSGANHKTKLLFLGKNYWTPEAAARAVDRASIALRGRTRAKTNFPIDWYGPEVIMNHIQHVTYCSYCHFH